MNLKKNLNFLLPMLECDCLETGKWVQSGVKVGVSRWGNPKISSSSTAWRRITNIPTENSVRFSQCTGCDQLIWATGLDVHNWIPQDVVLISILYTDSILTLSRCYKVGMKVEFSQLISASSASYQRAATMSFMSTNQGFTLCLFSSKFAVWVAALKQENPTVSCNMVL